MAKHKKLPKITEKKKKRKGRGYGSGKGGHTTGRGQKGQKSRSNLGVLFEGLKMKKSLIKRLPLQRGKGKFKPKAKPEIVNLHDLEGLRSGSKVTVDLLIKEGLADKDKAKANGVKILGDGEIKKKLNVEVPTSKSAAEKIKKAGGKISKEESKKETKDKEEKKKK